MKDPCRTCADKDKDFGGCRCQALAMTGDAANADPVCAKSPRHGDVQAIVMHAHKEQAAQTTQVEAVWQPVQRIVFRSDANSRKAGVP